MFKLLYYLLHAEPPVGRAIAKRRFVLVSRSEAELRTVKHNELALAGRVHLDGLRLRLEHRRARAGPSSSRDIGGHG
mgnify:CR=1 FL=1